MRHLTSDEQRTFEIALRRSGKPSAVDLLDADQTRPIFPSKARIAKGIIKIPRKAKAPPG